MIALELRETEVFERANILTSLIDKAISQKDLKNRHFNLSGRSL
jgi:Trp operon repressor